MLQGLRKQSQNPIIWVAFVIIILAFIFTFGAQPESCSSSSENMIVSVNGHQIDRREFHGFLKLYARIPYGSGDKDLDAPEVRLQVATNLGMVLYLADRAEAEGLRASEEEVESYIRGEFQCNPHAIGYLSGGFIEKNGARWFGEHFCYRTGTFDSERYESFLRQNGIAQGTFRNFKERELLAMNYLTLLDRSIVVSEHEILRTFEEHNTRHSIESITLSAQDVAHLTKKVTEAEVESFLKEKPEAIKNFYEENIVDYSEPTRWNLSEILIQRNNKSLKFSHLPEDNRPELAQKTPEERYTNLKALLASGSSAELFKATALAHNETSDPTAFNAGGKLGEVVLGGGLKEKTAALQGKKAGDIVEFENGSYYGLIFVHSMSKGHQDSLEKVQKEIARKILEEGREKETLDRVSQQLFEMLSESGGEIPQRIIDEALLYADMVDPNTPTEIPPVEPAPVEVPAENLPSDTTLGAAGDVPPVVPTTDVAKIPEGAVDVAEAPIVVPPAASVFVSEAERVRVSLSTAVALMSRTPRFSSGDPFGLGNSNELLHAVLKMKKKGELAPKVFTIDSKRVIVLFNEKQRGTEKDLAEQRGSISIKIRAEKTNALLGSWFLIFTYDHPIPSQQPYGAWLQTIYKEAISDPNGIRLQGVVPQKPKT